MYDVLDRLTVRAGALLLAEGEMANVAYLIQSGSVEIFVTRNGVEVLLAVRGAGEIIGEMAIIDTGKRSASVRIKEDCDLVIITREQIMHRLENCDPIIRMYLRTVIERLRETVLNVAGNKSVPQTPNAATGHRAFKDAIGTLSVESELRRALQQGELELYFQPIVNLADYRLAGFEALIRWNHPIRGLVAPYEFIPVAESSGLIVEITSWCLSQIGEIFPQIMAAALTNLKSVAPLFISMNVSGYDLGRTSFTDAVLAMLQKTAIPPESLKLEVTESVLMTDPERGGACLATCHDLGIKIAIDDFGTGFSSLSYLSTLPISTIKIDRSFVNTMLSDPKQMKIVQMILKLADELGFSVVAEGIEQSREAEVLEKLGCCFGQGYLFGRPVPLSKTLDLTRNWKNIFLNGESRIPAQLQASAV